MFVKITDLKIVQANHGGEALEMLAKSTYWNHGADSDIKPADRIELSVVLMDQEMVRMRSPANHRTLLTNAQPVMDGLTCTRKIRELERAGKFIEV